MRRVVLLTRPDDECAPLPGRYGAKPTNSPWKYPFWTVQHIVPSRSVVIRHVARRGLVACGRVGRFGITPVPSRSTDARRGQTHRQHLQRPAPARPRGARGGPQAAGHVHRLHRHPRPDALPVGDHRQLRRRGAGRRTAPGSTSRCTRTGRPRCTTTAAASRSTRSPRPGCPASRSSSPSCTRAASSAAARTPPPAVCTASVPRSSTRSPRGSTSRSTGRRRPRRCPSSAAFPGVFTGEGPSAPFEPAVGPAQGRPGQEGRHRHPHPVLAGPPDLHPRREVQLRRAGHPGAADLVHRPGTRAVAHRPARRRAGHRVVPPRRWHHRVLHLPQPRRAGHRRAPAPGLGPVHRDGAAARRQGPHDAPGRRARAARRRGAALGDGLRDRDALVRQRDRDPEGRHPRRRLRGGADEDVQRRRCAGRGCSRPTTAT